MQAIRFIWPNTTSHVVFEEKCECGTPHLHHFCNAV
jgi:hypothetical protein